jgi:hypothetical protein
MRRLRNLVWSDIVLSAVLGALGILLFIIGYNVQHVSACQARVNDATRTALTQRSDAATKMNTAQDELFNVLLDPTKTPADRLVASTRYHAIVHAATVQRDANPLPTDNCH